MSKNILLIDDDALMRRSLGFNLEQAGFQVFTASSAEDGLALAKRTTPDLVLLDINLPGMDGLDALRRFREEIGVPVIFVTARRRELDQVLGLELGADDYITKPFDFNVLLARIKAVLRRVSGGEERKPAEPQPLLIGELRIDPLAHTVHRAGKPIDLSPREFDLLYTLALEAGKVVPADELLARVWGAEFVGEPQVLYVHIRWLREKLEDDPQNPRYILTVRGVGYKLVGGEDA
ncbi:response regulator transcription factor [Anaerolinea sp.]|uniref:response regulator transcription factor n=1 Tax=Anaerolinea sp. TaxID=1872519 RepID=UPI002ACECC22|nr:response regulator transcription factor [Anaerolinea sp.]